MASRLVPRSAGARVLAAAVAVALVVGAVVLGTRLAETSYRTESRMLTVQTGPRGDEPVRLDTTLYVPETATPEQPAPAVLLPHGFGGSKDSVTDDAADLARLGYVVLAWSAEGFGRSGGQIHLNSPDYEVTDARRLIDWLAGRPEVRLDGRGDPRVGVAGGSYGGALALLTSAYDRRVDAIVPQITWNDLGRSLFPDAAGGSPASGVVKRAWLGQLFTGGLDRPPANGRAAAADPGCGRFAPDVCGIYREVLTTGRPTGEAARVLARSSPAGVLDRITAPTLLVQGTADSLFPLGEADANARGIAATGTPVRVAWFSGGHDGGTGSAEDEDRVKALTAQWLGHYLRGEGPAPGTSFTFSRVIGRNGEGDPVTTGLTTRDYPGIEGDRSPSRLTLAGPPQPVANPPGGTPAALSSLPGTGLVEDGAEAAGLSLATEIPGQAAFFESKALDEPLDVTGSAKVRIRATASTGSAVLFAKLYDVAPGERATLVGGQAAPVRLTGLPRSPDARALGAAEPVEVELPAVVHRFAAEHKLRVVLATADQAHAGPTEPATYVVGLADQAVTVPRVAAQPASDPAGVWRWVLGALLVLIAVGLAVVTLVARGRRRRIDLGVDEAYADVPLVVRDVHKTYADGFVAVRGVSFTVGRGQVVGLLGPNGAGKTTVLRVLLGLMRPTAGDVLAFGHPVTPGAAVLARLGALVEGPGFLPHLSGADNLALYWRSTGRPEREAHADEALAIAGLGDAVHRRVRTYSHGMKQRLAIAQAMLGLPELLVLDEPTDGLDPPQIAEMRRVLQRYASDGRSVLVSSHLLAEVEQTCTHVVVMSQGERVAAGSVAEIIGVDEVLPQHRLEDAFLALLDRGSAHD
ncbi:MAG: alpha/beta fold hydrolase [Streptosporangiales bacterium]|nr:alpha/beta fold hydrolase [Streptosporangiales bacterium]